MYFHVYNIYGNYNIDVMLMLVNVYWVSTRSFANNLCVTKFILCTLINTLIEKRSSAGSFASNDTSGNAYNITKTHLHGECFVTAGDRTLKIWRIEAEKRRVRNLDVEVGKLKRIINCIAVDERDEIVYCGTSSGDIIKARS